IRERTPGSFLSLPRHSASIPPQISCLPGNPTDRSKNCRHPHPPLGFSPNRPRRNPSRHTTQNRSPSRHTSSADTGDTCTVRASSDTASASSDTASDNNRGSRDILEPGPLEASSACADPGNQDGVWGAGETPDGGNPVLPPSDRDSGGGDPSTPDSPTRVFRGFCRDKTRTMKRDTDTPSSAACALSSADDAPFWAAWALFSEVPPPLRPPPFAVRRVPALWECAPSFPPPE